MVRSTVWGISNAQIYREAAGFFRAGGSGKAKDQSVQNGLHMLTTHLEKFYNLCFGQQKAVDKGEK